jgi:hypothetical protein
MNPIEIILCIVAVSFAAYIYFSTKALSAAHTAINSQSVLLKLVTEQRDIYFSAFNQMNAAYINEANKNRAVEVFVDNPSKVLN